MLAVAIMGLTGLWYVALVQFLRANGKGLAEEVSDLALAIFLGAPGICLLLLPMMRWAYQRQQPKRSIVFWIAFATGISPWFVGLVAAFA